MTLLSFNCESKTRWCRSMEHQYLGQKITQISRLIRDMLETNISSWLKKNAGVFEGNSLVNLMIFYILAITTVVSIHLRMPVTTKITWTFFFEGNQQLMPVTFSCWSVLAITSYPATVPIKVNTLLNLKMLNSKRNILFQGAIFRFYVSFRGWISSSYWKEWWFFSC